MDESGNGNHAHPDGTVAATDKFGNFQSAYFFDGEKSSMTAPVCIVPDVMPRVTIVAWARADQQDRPATVISNADTHPTGRSLQMRPSPSKGTSWATSTNNLGSWVWHKVAVGEWTFLAVSYDQPAGKLRLHVNGTRYDADCLRNGGDTELTIGKCPHLGEFFHGCLDEIRIYDRILSDDEVATLFRQFQTGVSPNSENPNTETEGRTGLAVIFGLCFSFFAAVVLTANLMIRR